MTEIRRCLPTALLKAARKKAVPAVRSQGQAQADWEHGFSSFRRDQVVEGPNGKESYGVGCPGVLAGERER